MNVQQSSIGNPARWTSGTSPKERVAAALRSDERMRAVKVTAVRDGVVHLSTKGASLQEQLRAIELAWGVAGVASEA